jgi:hypothetical protein
MTCPSSAITSMDQLSGGEVVMAEQAWCRLRSGTYLIGDQTRTFVLLRRLMAGQRGPGYLGACAECAPKRGEVSVP